MDIFGNAQVKIIPLDLAENQFQIYNKISRNYSHSFLFESLSGPEVLAETSVMGFDPKIIFKGYEILGLQTYFTAGPQEIRAWTIKKNATAPNAAGVIHTDFERGFIKAEVISFDDYISCNGELGSKEKGKLRLEGKEYLVRDGDVIHFKFNV